MTTGGNAAVNAAGATEVPQRDLSRKLLQAALAA
jgi:hypothetical protein